jgi:hypothetical protein
LLVAIDGTATIEFLVWRPPAVPADWIAAQLDFMLSWEMEKLAPGLL